MSATRPIVGQANNENRTLRVPALNEYPSPMRAYAGDSHITCETNPIADR